MPAIATRRTGSRLRQDVDTPLALSLVSSSGRRQGWLHWPAINPRTYERVTLAAVWLIGIIVVTGGAVRLTGSGLGCTDWPTCTNNQIYPEWQFHGWVEFGNRLVTGAVSIAVVVAVLGSLARKPRRRDLTWLSWGLVAGVVAQIVLGGVVVLSHLWPPFVMTHFIVSQALVLDAVVLYHRTRRPDGTRQQLAVTPTIRALGRILVGLTALAIVTGTVVTGTGPHSGAVGNDMVKRLPFAISTVARVHGLVDMSVLITIAVLVWQLWRRRVPRAVLARAEVILVFGVLQAAIGYTQYFTGVPVILVALHILGATLVWTAVVWFYLGLFEPGPTRAQLDHDDSPRSTTKLHGDDGSDGNRSGRNLVTER